SLRTPAIWAARGWVMKPTSWPDCARCRAICTYCPGMFWWMKSTFISSASLRLITSGPQIERGAAAQRDLDKPCFGEQPVQGARGETSAVRHELIAARQR